MCVLAEKTTQADFPYCGSTRACDQFRRLQTGSVKPSQYQIISTKHRHRSRVPTRFLLRLSERMNQDLIISKLLQCERSLTQVCTRWSSARGRDCVPSGERIRTRAARCQLSLCLIELFSSNTTDGPHRTV